MRAYILQLDLVFRLQKYDERKGLSLLMDSTNYRHYISESVDIFLSYDDYGPSVRSLHSWGLKIEPQSTFRSQSNGRQWKGTLVTKIEDMEGLVFRITKLIVV